MFAKLKFRTQLFLGNGLILALMIVISIVVYMSVNYLLYNFNWVNHTHNVLRAAATIEASAIDMETGMRGYLLAGKKEFLDPYTAGNKKFNEMIVKLAETVNDNPAQVQLLKETKETIEQWQANVTEPAIELRAAIGNAKTMNDMAALIRKAEGEKYFDQFRGQIATFIERETALLGKRQEQARNSRDVEELKQLTAWVTHTYYVLATANAILASTVDMETGVRGFLLAGRKEFLEPYQGGKENFYRLTTSLVKTVDDNPAQVALLGAIQTTITDWDEKVVAGQIALRREIGDAKTMDDMAALVGEARGKAYFDKFRGQIKTFQDREVALMEERMNSLASITSRTINISKFGTLLAFLLGVGIVIGSSYILSARIARPVVFMSATLEQISSGNLELDQSAQRQIQRIGKRGDELADMGGSIERMVEQLTERKKLQDQLHQSQKMELIGQLAGGVAHDFNNMLGVILGYAQLAMRKIAPDEPLYANLDEIRKAAERSADLTQQLLAFARQQTVAPKVLDLNETVNDMLNMLRRLIGEDMDLAWRPGNNLRSVFIDPSQVDQILTNLCVNARDAIADTGKITIETASVSFDDAYCADLAGFVPGEFVMLAVSDDGCGMDAETLSHLFEPFFSTKEMGKGTGLGLGLATVYGIAKQNNGFINVYSEPVYGTTFKIYLPQHAAKAAPRSEQEQAPVPTSGGETILLVEDEPAILAVTTMMLDEMGYAVIAAGSPGEAIRLAREHHGRIDLLMTDVVMPEMNGRDLAGNLMSIYPDIRCLFMSGYTANVIAHHGVLDPDVHFLQKPFSMQGMTAKVREALDHKEPTRKND